MTSRSDTQRARAIGREVDARLREETNLERKKFTEGYFPSALENLGVAVPAMRAVVRDLKRRLKAETGPLVHEVARAILSHGTLEGRNAGYFVLNEHPDAIASLTSALVEEFGAGMDNWTSVDTFGCYVAGPAWREGRIQDAAVKRWARSKDRWWRRAALTSTVALNLRSRGGSGDTPRTLEICGMLAADHDDMVVKALSWALRSLAGTDPSAASAFLERHTEELHPRVGREVGNKLTTGLKTPKTNGAGTRRRKA